MLLVRKEIVDLVAEDAKRLDEIKYQVGDVLDVKASIILVAVTFLATLSGEILAVSDLPAAIKIIQVVAVVAVSVGGISTLWALWPRKFDIPPRPDESSAYAEELEEHFRGKLDSDELIVKQFTQTVMTLRLERIAANDKLASSKTKLNKCAFYSIGVAVFAELASLLWLAICHLHLTT